MRRPRWGLLALLMVSILGTAAVAGVAGVLVQGTAARQALAAEVDERNLALARQVAARLDARLADRLDLLRTIAASEPVAVSASDLDAELRVLLAASPQFDELVVYDDAGRPVAAAANRFEARIDAVGNRPAELDTRSGPAIAVEDGFPASVAVAVSAPHRDEAFAAAREKMQIYGMWLSFALAAGVITFFAARMAEELRRQEQMRALRREEGARDQQLLAVATEAAGAAHELGTPLATMSVLLKEMQQDHKDPALQEDLSVLQDQVKLCKETLQQLVRAAEANRRLAVQEQTVTHWLDQALNRWHLMRPEASYRFQRLGQGDVPMIAPPPDLTQALLNLLNNAADACPEGLEVNLDWSAVEISIRIRDHGAGVPLAVAEQIGKPFFTTKGKGFGLGLFLSKASVTRAGGSVKLYPHEEGGTLTELRLPRNATGDEA